MYLYKHVCKKRKITREKIVSQSLQNINWNMMQFRNNNFLYEQENDVEKKVWYLLSSFWHDPYPTSGQNARVLRGDIERDMTFLWKVTDKEKREQAALMVVERRIRNDANALTTKPF